MLIIWNNFKFDLKEKVVVDALFVFYVAYSAITGEYGYMKLFLIFYVLLLGETFEDNAETEESDNEDEPDCLEQVEDEEKE